MLLQQRSGKAMTDPRDTWTLDDGTALRLRPIRPGDAPIEQAFVRELSPESRFFRFMGEMRELSPEMLRHLTTPDPATELALIVTTVADGRERELAVGRFAHNPDGESCEFAIVVADAWQGKGIGKRLMQALIEAARTRGLQRFEGYVLASNYHMLDFVRALGFSVHSSVTDPTVKLVSLSLAQADGDRAVIVFNAGSSSVKFALYRTAGALDVLAHGRIENIEIAPRFVPGDGGVPNDIALEGDTVGKREHALRFLFNWIREHHPGVTLAGAGHRVVHGGTRFAAPCMVDASVLRELERFIPLAPLHQPHSLAIIRALAAVAPALPQVACFDTAFHLTQDRLATTYALPRELTDRGVRSYGFHGLSYEYIAQCLPEHLGDIAPLRIVAAHLGNGASLCAMRGGRSVATSMGFSALEGLVMGTRSGSIDPGVLLHLMREDGMDAASLEDLLYRRSGLLGVSGISHDMRVLLSSDDPRAAEAVDLFVHRAVSQIGALVATLGGIDALVFTAGIGENSPIVRERIGNALSWLGVGIDASRNAANGPRVSADGSRVSVWAIPTDEELMIARHAYELVGKTRHAG